MRDANIDTVTLEVIWSRLLSVANEQQETLMRTAFSTIVRESQDLACGLFDTKGRMISQSVSGTPGHINAMATSMGHFLTAFPTSTLAPGDVLITNDPWMTAGQINDITITTPIFKDGRLVALFANTCHAADIGGRILSAEAREVYEGGPSPADDEAVRPWCAERDLTADRARKTCGSRMRWWVTFTPRRPATIRAAVRCWR